MLLTNRPFQKRGLLLRNHLLKNVPFSPPFADSLLSQAFPKGGLRLCTKVYGFRGGGSKDNYKL